MIIFGKQCFEYVLKKAPHNIQEIYLSKEVNKDIFNKMKKLNTPIIRIDNKKAQSLAKGRNHQGLFAKINDLQSCELRTLLETNSLVVLCGLSDIGNIGSIIRTAFALGVKGAIICDRKMLDINALEGIFRASSGALLDMPFCFYPSSLELVNQLKNKHFTLIGSKSNSSKQANECNSNKWALFVGSEDMGLKQRLCDKLDSILSIKMRNSFDSLNVGVATGILIDRINKQFEEKL